MTLEAIQPAQVNSTTDLVRPARQEAILRACRSLLLVVVLVGAACRIVQYAWRTSLWHDEALVTLNVMHRSYGELTRPLDYEQLAAPAFLWGERWMLVHFGFGEYQLRLISLLCGIGSVAVFAWLVWRLFAAPVAVVVAALFAVCDKLIWHSAEVKPYAGDVFAAALLLFLAIGLRHPLSFAARVIVQSVVTSALLWFSLPAVFVFAGLALMLLPRVWRQARLPGLLIALFACLLPVLSFILLYRLTIQGHDPYLDRYWADGFADWSRAWLVPWWIAKQTYSLCDHPYRSFGWIVLPTAVIGAASLYRSDRRSVMWAGVGPIGLCLLAALAGKYPFTGNRVTLFLVPCLFLLMGSGLEAIYFRPALRRVWFLPALPLLVVGTAMAGRQLVHPHARSAMREIATYVRAHRQPGEAICLVGEPSHEDGHFTSGRNLELICYWPDVTGPLYGYPPQYPPLGEIPDVREKRFWIVFAALPEHGDKYMRRTLDEAEQIAIQVDSRQVPGGGAYLFEKRPR